MPQFDPPNSYPPQVERWRELVSRHFPPAQVGKAMWVINFESAGDPASKGDLNTATGVFAARGLFQIQSNANFPDRPSAEFLDIPENNVQVAAKMVGPEGRGWTHWGEGTAGQPPFDPRTGKGRFGALGNHPYPGDPAGGAAPRPATGGAAGGAIAADAAVTALTARVAALEALVQDLTLVVFAGSEQHDPGGQLLSRTARLEYARGRISEVVTGTKPSIIELIGSALITSGGMSRDELVKRLKALVDGIQAGPA